jgi:hypothetical protein
MGGPPQGRCGRRGARGRDYYRGSLPVLPVVRGRVTLLGARVRDPRSCRFARHPDTAISPASFCTPRSASLKQRVESSRLFRAYPFAASSVIFRWVGARDSSRHKEGSIHERATERRPTSRRRALSRIGARAPQTSPPVSLARRAEGAATARGQLRAKSRSFRWSRAVMLSRQNPLGS